MIIKINIVEVSSKLAEDKVNEELNFNQKMIYNEVSADETNYTEKAQKIFDEWYDCYYEFLLNLEKI